MLLSLLLIIIVLLFLLTGKKDKKVDDNSNKPVPQNNSIQNPPIRIMTAEEKTDTVGIDPNQEAEVVNDQGGLYIYRIKK